MYFTRKNDSKKQIRACFRREIHVVDDLKVNILIDIDIIDVENISIDVSNKKTRIKSCNVIVFIEVRISQRDILVFKSIHFRKTTMMSSRFEISIEIHYLFVSNNRDCFFELKKLSYLIFYAHIIDISINAIIVKNDFDHLIQISRNLRFDKLVQFEYSNAFHIDQKTFDDVRDLTAKYFKSSHQTRWFRKLITKCVVVFAITTFFSFAKIANLSKTSCLNSTLITFIVAEKSFAFEVILSNDVIIHIFDVEAVRNLRQIVIFFSKLWKDFEFAKMSQENWMRILLKFDWESRVIERVKISFRLTRSRARWYYIRRASLLRKAVLNHKVHLF